MGYSSCQEFLDDFYFDFDVRVQQMPIATLINPVADKDETNPTVNISWTPLKAGVKLNVSVSTDNAKTWTEVVNRTTGTSCVWNSGDISTQFYIKLTAPDNLNLSTTYGPFIKGNLNKLSFVAPVVNNYLISGDTTAIKWATTGIQNIKIDYSLNNGTSWTNISSNIATSGGAFNWIIPTDVQGTCKLRLTDATNSSKLTESETFTIVKPNEIGGPYLYDKNTLLLLHFDNDLNNRSKAAPNATGNVLNLTNEAAFINDLGLSYKNSSALSVQHHTNLNLTGDWTIEAWVKLTAYNANSNMYLFWKPGDTDAYQSNYSLEINPWWGNVFYGYYFSELNNRIGITGNSPVLNEWYHVAFIRDTKKKEIRIVVHDKNKTQVSSTTTSYTPENTFINTKDLQIGTGFSGFIDEVRISNVVRSFINTGLDKSKEEDVISLFPNPAKDMLYLNHLSEKYLVKIISMSGEVIFAKKMSGSPNEIIDVSGIKSGIYFIQFIGYKNKFTEKLIIN